MLVNKVSREQFDLLAKTFNIDNKLVDNKKLVFVLSDKGVTFDQPQPAKPTEYSQNDSFFRPKDLSTSRSPR